MKIEDFITNLVNRFPLKRTPNQSFYEFVQIEFNKYVKLIDELNEEEILSIISSEFKQNPTKVRLKNLIQSICDSSLKILLLVNQGNIYDATTELNKLLTSNNAIQYKLNETFITHFNYKYYHNTKFFRIVDFNIKETPNNCNHVPFQYRDKAKDDRFNLNCYPCLYLSNSLEGCIEELGVINDDKIRYWSVFSPIKTIWFISLIIPNKNDIITFSEYEKFKFIITYPFFVLCLTECCHSFKEEYLFPQLIFHFLFMQSKCNIFSNYVGVAYSSTKNTNYVNYVIPAKMPKTEVQKEGYSEHIYQLFKENFQGKLI